MGAVVGFGGLLLVLASPMARAPWPYFATGSILAFGGLLLTRERSS